MADMAVDITKQEILRSILYFISGVSTDKQILLLDDIEHWCLDKRKVLVRETL